MSILVVSACTLQAAPLKNVDRDEWLSIYTSGAKVGFLHKRIERTALHGTPVYLITREMNWKFKVKDTSYTDVDKTEAYINEEFMPVYSTWQNKMIDNKRKIETVCGTEATFQTGYIDWKSNDNGKISRERITVPNGFDLTVECKYDLGLLRLQPNKTIHFYHFDEMTPDLIFTKKSVIRKEKVKACGRVYDAFVTCDDGNLKVFETANGEIIKRETKSSHMTYIKTTKEEALKCVKAGAMRANSNTFQPPLMPLKQKFYLSQRQ